MFKGIKDFFKNFLNNNQADISEEQLKVLIEEKMKGPRSLPHPIKWDDKKIHERSRRYNKETNMK